MKLDKNKKRLSGMITIHSNCLYSFIDGQQLPMAILLFRCAVQTDAAATKRQRVLPGDNDFSASADRFCG